VFVNEIVQLRAVEPEDLDRLYDWENNPQLWTVGNTRNPYSRYVLKQYILDSDKDIYETHQLRLMMVSVKTGETVGTVDLFDFDIYNSRIALGLFVDTDQQGKGFAKATLRLVEEYVFSFLQINQLYCHIAETNTASRHMFEKEGYEINGILKNWVKTPNGYDNIIVFQRFKQIVTH
jgi:diamine N-acetyltransferase